MFRLTTAVTLTASALILTACVGGGEDQQPVPEDQIVRPAKVASDWVTTEVGGVTISTPDAWEKTGPITPAEGAVQYAFQTPVNSFGTRGGAQLVTFESAKKPAEDLVDNIAAEAKATIGATDIDTRQVVWPGAKDAWFVSYEAQVPSGGDTAPHPTEVLILDLPGGGQAQATVTALDEDFEKSQTHKVLETVVIADATGSKES